MSYSARTKDSAIQARISKIDNGFIAELNIQDEEQGQFYKTALLRPSGLGQFSAEVGGLGSVTLETRAGVPFRLGVDLFGLGWRWMQVFPEKPTWIGAVVIGGAAMTTVMIGAAIFLAKTK